MKKATLTYRYNFVDNQYSVICLDWENLVYTCADTVKECYENAIEATQLAIEAYNKKELVPAQQPKIMERHTLKDNEFQITFDFENVQPLDIKIVQRIKYTKEFINQLQPIFG